MKHIFTCLLVLCLLLSLVACGGDAPEQSTTDGTTASVDETTTAVAESTIPPIPEELSKTPALTLVEQLAPEAKLLNSSTRGCQVVLKKRDTADDIVAAFLDAGYYDYPIDTVEGAKITTHFLIGAYSTVAIHHDPARKQVRIIWENLADFDTSILDRNEQTDTGSLAFVQIGTERVGEKDNPLNGMIYLIKLADGRAILIDGGTGNDRNVANIYAALGKLDIAKDADGRYVIAAWIVTHAHGDHVGAATTFLSKHKAQVNVERFMYNFTRDAAVIGTDQSAVSTYESLVKSAYPEAQRLVAHANMTYYIGNATLTMLYSPELIYDEGTPLSYYNNSSLVFQIGVGESDVFVMGDAANSACRELVGAYETSAFASDVLQITHHGLFTESNGHTWFFVKNVYEGVGAKLAVLPMQSQYEGESRNGRYTVLGEWAKSGHQISFVMNRRDTAALDGKGLTQAVWDEFETRGTVYGKKVETVFGYDGCNTVTNADGMVTYLGGNRSEPMATVFELDGTGARVVTNEVLATWLG